MQKKVAAQIDEGETVIDIACGTGAQVFEMITKAKYAVGIDLSESMMKVAQKEKEKRNWANVDFLIADATKLVRFKQSEFDVATMSLALHQFPPELYSPILTEMKRVAKRLVLVDYAVPRPKSRVANCKSLLRNLDTWIRRKLRCYRLKQYKRTITLKHFLKNLGVLNWQSWILALSGKGWWRKSGCAQVYQAMNLKWFEDLGLFNMSNCYVLLLN